MNSGPPRRREGAEGISTSLRSAPSSINAGIHREDSRTLTAHDVLHCELEIVLAAKTGRSSHVPRVAAPSLSASLSSEQPQAAEHILGSRGFITLFWGGAGTGKSFPLKEVERGLSAARHPVVVLTPQRQQVRDLQTDGLPPQTLAQAFISKSLPPRVVVLLDEAGPGRKARTARPRQTGACPARSHDPLWRHNASMAPSRPRTHCAASKPAPA